MAKTAEKRSYQPTEAKYKGGAQEMYITYDLEQETRGGGHATYPKVKRVYIAGDVDDWQVGDFARKTGREIHGVKVTNVGERFKPKLRNNRTTRTRSSRVCPFARISRTRLSIDSAALVTRIHPVSLSVPR